MDFLHAFSFLFISHVTNIPKYKYKYKFQYLCVFLLMLQTEHQALPNLTSSGESEVPIFHGNHIFNLPDFNSLRRLMYFHYVTQDIGGIPICHTAPRH